MEHLASGSHRNYLDSATFDNDSTTNSLPCIEMQ